MKKIQDNILCWCNNPEQGAIEQAINISKHPCLIGNVCLMPDTHEGYGMPIGGVVALDNAVCPNMVGVDIGCGMLAVKTSLTEISTEQLKKIMGLIRQKVPVGFNHHKEVQNHDVFAISPNKGNKTICYEVKVSRSDFKNDIKKEDKQTAARCFANQFYYCTPKGLLNKDEVPVWAGLIEFDLSKPIDNLSTYYPQVHATYVKNAPVFDKCQPTWGMICSAYRNGMAKYNEE